MLSHLHKQSGNIAQGVDTGGAGDQGMMFGFACRETSTLMPLPIYLAHRLVENHASLRETGAIKWLRPDAKSQVTVEYEADGTPHRIHTVVLSTQHDDSVMSKKGGQEYFSDEARKIIVDKPGPAHAEWRAWPDLLKGDFEIVLPGVRAPVLTDDSIRCHINPTGCFLVGGPHGDCGLTGRKIIVDTYGGRGRHGGGAFSGKDPTKVDRSAAYMARYIAKNIVAADLADECEVQLSYAIGYPDPLNIWVNTNGTIKGGATEDQLVDLIRKHFKLTPKESLESFSGISRRPIYKEKPLAMGTSAGNCPISPGKRPTRLIAPVRKRGGQTR